MMLIPANEVPAGLSLNGLKRMPPSNTTTSPATGAAPPTQLAAVVQLSSAPPPFHTTVAAAESRADVSTAAHAPTTIAFALIFLRAAIWPPMSCRFRQEMDRPPLNCESREP